jgi:hypothetical protein
MNNFQMQASISAAGIRSYIKGRVSSYFPEEPEIDQKLAMEMKRVLMEA